ncbi:MAG: radical SAM protein [Bdellovibrionales bacterium]|nr:radical SAM protein [Bdellovibrionales bacterium]
MGKWKKQSKNKHFCVVPWTHHYISPQSERRLCCASREAHSFTHQYLDASSQSTNGGEYRPQTLKEYWNSPKIREIRLKMLKGEEVPECVVCQTQELSISTYKDYFTKDLFPHLIKEIYKSTAEDGSTEMKCRSFDYRLFNDCNFKCRMCGNLLSSSWEQELRQHKRWNPEQDVWMRPEVKREILQFQKNVARQEFFQALDDGEVEEIYWVGGEPLVWPDHWESMQRLVDKKLAAKVFCRYNTNLSIIERKGVHLFRDLLPHFKGYMIQASIDGCGAVGEYIRTGLNWESWLENYKEGLKWIKNENGLVMDLTLTLPGLFSVVELVSLAESLKTRIYPKLVYAFDPSITISPLALPRSILNSFIDDLIAELTPICTYRTRPVIELLQNIKSRQTHEEKYENVAEALRRGKQYQLSLEAVRSSKVTLRDIYSQRSEVMNWWSDL